MTPANHQEIKELINQAIGAERFRFRRRLNDLIKNKGDNQEKQWADLKEHVVRSCERRALRMQQRPEISYPDLPVSDKRDDIADAIQNNQVVIIAGETGSGKTTQIPKICLELGRGVDGLIGHTQPRRLAARSVATRIAEEVESPLGHHVGFKVRFSDQVSENSYIKLMTDGILLAEIQQDRFLNQYDTIIIDEAHERSLNIDFILGYLKQLLPKRPDLKVIITSATIDPERFSQHFNQAPIIQVSGRTYPVEIRYRPFDDPEQNIDQTQAIINAVHELSGEGKGDILVFLSGEREIRDTADALSKEKLGHTEILPLYARLSASEQNKIFHPKGTRRIVLSTNVAETSLTVPGIKYVIDPGMARISRYSVRSKVQRLPIEPISQASANQRSGRCGRVSEGICIRLYSEDDYLSRDEFTAPEILRTNLASVILQMLSLGLGNIDAFPFVQPPDSRNINDGFRLLEELRALEKQKGRARLTQMGRQIAKLPVDPRYARMVVESAEQGCIQEVIVIAAGLSIQDPRERPQEKRQAADEAHSQWQDKASDFIALYNLYSGFREQQKALSNNQLRKWCKTQFVNYLRMREWQDIVSQLKKAIAELGFRLNSEAAEYDAIHIALLSGLLSHMGVKDKEKEYIGARNSRFLIFPGSPLSKKPPKWTMVAELTETSRLFGRVAANIQSQWAEPLAKHLVKYQHSEPHWSKKQGIVKASEKALLYGLTIIQNRSVNFGKIDANVSRDIFIREALVNGDTKINETFLTANQDAVANVLELEDKSRRRDILVDESDLIAFYSERIPAHICSEASFKKWWKTKREQDARFLHFDPEALFKRENIGVSPLDFPDAWQQNNLSLPVNYHFEPKDEDDGVSLMVPLPLLNQLENVGFDWLIPGLRHELIVALIKGLPKKLRRNFVPAPDYATACLEEIQPTDKKGNSISLLDALSLKLKRMTGIDVLEEDWQREQLPKHLLFNFKVLDGKGQVIKQGRDLLALKESLKGKVSDTLKKVATPDVEQTGLTEWNFPPLQKEFISKQGGFEVKAFPALVAESASVGIKLFDHPEKARNAHQIGLRELVKLNIPSPVKYLQEKLPNKAKLGLYFNPFGKIQDLINDCINCGVDALIQEFQLARQSDVRQEDEFMALRDVVREHINEKVLIIASSVEKGLTTAHGVQKKLKGNVPLTMINAHGDIKQHLNSLVYSDFVSDIGEARLEHWNRYIEGIARRLEKLPIDPAKDRMHQMTVEKVQAQYEAVCNKLPVGAQMPDSLKEIRWMIEELRVSLFAQQLGTSIPISAKRITNHLNEI
ncbi:ATP-dependent RNA helicase HrpA [Aestuariibacter sp. AA17]|uniref:ATP-dependent RNA helicase HrpA n=1 Tax=Fluctibacter corallii TaxID=2984329 RepID=A0ABT3A9K7_9ALTE|nr:ATP-dependent RNA helicase HrpA [Aestuariibacter sp. AA17]MCV2885363.1 ATP-dependent RNA helicase HrpA [Aestuariibacter sp. AA17]